jgi:flavin reductase (DIM6/NTAB) family NADH-FMN oxidoreductase RutF
MKKDLGLVQAVYPMPVLMVAAYDENGKVNVMNVAWGQICDEDKIILFIGEGKRTWLNIKASRAFTVALADREHMDVADFFGIASGNKIDDKFERTGYHAVKSDKVNAPIIEEFPLVMECELLDILDTTQSDVRRALASDISDFEDAVMAETALREGMDCIVTRNLPDFSRSPVPVYAPHDLLLKLEQPER